MDTLLVSIVIPAHNEERWIASCIKSFVSQTYKNTEIIVVDDHSTDDTKKIAESFSGVSLISMDHLSGEANVRSAGASSSRGDIIIQTDCDAVYPPEFIETTLKHFEDPGVDGLSVGRIFVLEERKGLIADYFRVKRESSFLVRNAGIKPPAGCFAMRRDVFEKNGPYDPSMTAGTDVDFSRRMGEKEMKIVWAKDTYFHHADPDKLSVFLRRIWNGAIYGKNLQKKWGGWPRGLSLAPFLARNLLASLIPVAIIAGTVQPLFLILAFLLFSIEGVAPLVFLREQRTMAVLAIKQKKFALLFALPVLLFLQLRASAYGKLYAMTVPHASQRSVTFDVKE